MCSKRLLRTVLAWLLVFGVFTAGCGGNKKVNAPFQARSDLKKKVAVVTFDNRTSFYPEDMGQRMAVYMARALETSRGTLVINPEETQKYISAHGLPLPLTQNTAVLLGRAQEANVVILGTIAKVETEVKNVGWLPYIPLFKNKKPVVSVELMIKAIDADNGVVLLASAVSHSRRMEKGDEIYDDPAVKAKLDPEAARKALAEAAMELTGRINKIMKDMPWKGFVAGVSDSSVTISAGIDVGIRRGQRFVVYQADEKIASSTGRVYSTPGQVKAVLEVTNVLSKSAKAKINSGEVHPGDTVYPAGG